ncbi:MAG: HlyD family efflux transporter periplasmic adaptor subunit [Desulfatitalea sp.]|nr:HlyD family efflux transporter periplasmic adaptor subunit [Desulfatitalea sp.]
MLPKARMLASPAAKTIYGLFALMGLYFLTQRFESYVSTFSNFFNLKGLIAFSAVIVVLKAAHELGHAFVAKHYGLRVPTMGIALMVFFPVAYSDVTDAWRMQSRYQRVQIALAGIKVELVIGALALACWGVTQPGIVNSICFILSSTSLVSSVLVNLNPAMRYDGYYILSDLWRIDNLSEQAGLFTKWYLKRILLGMNTPSPIKKISARRQWQMVVYSFFAWHYRFFLYLGIAVLVYYKFTKPIGITLFILEIATFIVHPIFIEMNTLRKEKHLIKLNKRLFMTSIVLLLLFGWTMFSFPRVTSAPAVYLPEHSQMVYTHEGGQVTDIYKKRGELVLPGDTLMRIESQTLNNDIDFLRISVKHLRHTINNLKGNPENLGLVPEIEKQLASSEEELAGLMEKKEQLVIKAKITGVLAELDDLLQPGCYVKRNQVLGRIVGYKKARIDAFVSEKEIRYILQGGEVVFCPKDHSGRISGKIERINPIREQYVEIQDIGTVAAKALPLVKDDLSDRMTFVESYYKVQITPILPQDNKVRLGTSGHVWLHTAKQSLALKLFQNVYALFIRESGF